MAIVTLTGHLGSMGDVPRHVARTLGYRLANREIMLEAVDALGWSADDVEALDERTGGFGRQVLNALSAIGNAVGTSGFEASGLAHAYGRSYAEAAAAEMLPPDQRYIDALRAVMRGLADQGDVVLVGRGGQAILADRTDAVHVRVVCAPEERARRVAERDQITLDAATARVHDSDKQREAWHHKYLGIDYRSPYLYDLMVNTGRLPDTLAAAMIVETVRRLHAPELPDLPAHLIPPDE